MRVAHLGNAKATCFLVESLSQTASCGSEAAFRSPRPAQAMRIFSVGMLLVAVALAPLVQKWQEKMEEEEQADVVPVEQMFPVQIPDEDPMLAHLNKHLYGIENNTNHEPIIPLYKNFTFEQARYLPQGDNGAMGGPWTILHVFARLPNGETVLCLIFRGTQSLSDFVIQTPFQNLQLTDDKDFPIHNAAASARDALISTRLQTIELLEKAMERGVQQILFSGHSLGGQYAQGALFSFWKDRREKPPTGSKLEKMRLWELLQPLTARCVAFGSPPAFGWKGPSPLRDQFVDDMVIKANSINYQNEDDPVPFVYGSGIDTYDLARLGMYCKKSLWKSLKILKPLFVPVGDVSLSLFATVKYYARIRIFLMISLCLITWPETMCISYLFTFSKPRDKTARGR